MSIRRLHTNSVFGRVLLGIGANAAGKFWIILLQLVSVPILITKWGASEYGVWLMLSAVPSYIALSDLGFGTAAAVDMTKRVALKDRDGALTAFQSVWAFISAISAGILLLAVVAWLFRQPIQTTVHMDGEVFNAAQLLILVSLLGLQMGVVNIAFRSVGRYAQGTFFFDLLTPIEGVMLLIVAIGGGHLVAGATAILVIRLTGVCLYYRSLRRTEPWVRFGLSHASTGEIRTLAKPALAALSLPLSTALSIQGIIFVVGLAISPIAAATFGTIRTITRLPLQIVGIFSRATLPEITIAYAQRELIKLNLLVGANLLTFVLVTLPAAVALTLFGQWCLDVLTRGRIHAPLALFLIMTVIMVFQTFWNTVGNFLFALNLQQRFAHIYAALSIVSLITCYFVAKWLGLEWMAAVLIVVDGIVAAVTMREWSRISSVSWGSQLRSAIQLVTTLIQKPAMP
jgi:O-antigen/teichoic acid export membrane protein